YYDPLTTLVAQAPSDFGEPFRRPAPSWPRGARKQYAILLWPQERGARHATARTRGNALTTRDSFDEGLGVKQFVCPGGQFNQPCVEPVGQTFCQGMAVGGVAALADSLVGAAHAYQCVVLPMHAGERWIDRAGRAGLAKFVEYGPSVFQARSE